MDPPSRKNYSTKEEAVASAISQAMLKLQTVIQEYGHGYVKNQFDDAFAQTIYHSAYGPKGPRGATGARNVRNLLNVDRAHDAISQAMTNVSSIQARTPSKGIGSGEEESLEEESGSSCHDSMAGEGDEPVVRTPPPIKRLTDYTAELQKQLQQAPRRESARWNVDTEATPTRGSRYSGRQSHDQI